MPLTEDDLYKQSTQFKYWSFTPDQLSASRVSTNKQATERVKANVARQRAVRARSQVESANTSDAGSGIENGSNTPLHVGADKEVNCLTVAEEKKLVDTFCERALELGDHLKFPFDVTVCLRLRPICHTRS
jgi:cyclin H